MKVVGLDQTMGRGLEYLRKDYVRNGTEIWAALNGQDHFHLFFALDDSGGVRGHMSYVDLPDTTFASMTGDEGAAEALLELVPKKTVLIVPPNLLALTQESVAFDAVYRDDLMLLVKGAETLPPTRTAARRLTLDDLGEYSRFFDEHDHADESSRWKRDKISRHAVFGVFAEGRLASKAVVMNQLPEVAWIMDVSTRQEFQRRGLAAAAVAAAVDFALSGSETCVLGVRSNNLPAISLYRKLGFTKVAEEFWFDMGAGKSP